MTEVEVLTTDSCPYCVKLKNWLEDEGIEYQEYQPGDSREKTQEFMQKTGRRGVPQTIIKKEGDEVAVVGFQPEKIKKEV